MPKSKKDSDRERLSPWGASILERLARAAELRILVDRGNGMGHQSASIQLARRIIARAGITSASRLTLTFVYPTNSEKQKIEKLAPGGRLGGVAYRMLSEQEVQRESWIDFGFTGGSDRPSTEDMTGVVKSRYFVKLQPFRWHQDEVIQCNDSYLSSTSTDVIGSHPAMENVEYENSWYPSDPIPVPDWSDVSGNRAALKAVVDAALGTRRVSAVHRQRLLLWPIYGIGSNNPFGEETYRLLTNMVRGAAAARADGTWEGSVLIVDLSQDRKEDGWKRAYEQLTEHFEDVYVQQLESVPTLLGTMRLKSSGRPFIGICHISGGKPNDLMRYIYDICDLPPVFEGQGTASDVVPLGKPFLKPSMRYMAKQKVRLTPRPSDYDYMPLAGYETTAKRWQEMANHLIEEEMEPAELVAFLEDAISPGSASDRYFKAVGSACGDPTGDRLTMALGLLGILRENSAERAKGIHSMIRFDHTGSPARI